MTRAPLLGAASGLLLSLLPSPVRADSAKQQCVSAFEAGQRSQMAGDLQQAIERFESCTASDCPPIAQRECSRLLEVAKAAMPTIRFELKLGTNAARRPVVLSVDDGEPRVYDGEVLHVNPGKHRFVFECEGFAPVTRRIAFSEWDSKRKEVAFHPARGAIPPALMTRSVTAPASLSPLPSPSSDGARLRDAVIIGSATALATAGGIGFIGFGLHARSSERALLECAPYCSGASIAEVKRSYLLANVSLGAGVLAVGSATIWWFGLRPSLRVPGRGGKSGNQWSIQLGAISTVTQTF